MTTILRYNGVTLRNVHTKKFDQRCEYDQSGADLLRHEFTIRVATIVHASNAQTVLGMEALGSVSSAADLQRAAQGVLMLPRKQLTYTVGGVTLLAVEGDNTALRDVDNGPKPQHLEITQVINDVFRIEFEIKACVVKCGSGGSQSGSVVLSNKWSLNDTIDRNQYTTRVLSGRLTVGHINNPTHAFRPLVVPPLQNGFYRESMDFTSTPDGLNFDYTITDKQGFAAPPWPATEWTGVHIETLGVGGAVGHVEVRVHLEGPPKAKRSDLITAAVRTVQARLGNFRSTFAGDNPLYVLESAAIEETLHANEVDVVIRALRVPRDENKTLNIPIVSAMGKHLNEGPSPLPGYKPDLYPVPDLYDSNTPIGVFFQYAQSPCNDQHAVPQPAPIPPDQGQGQGQRDNSRRQPTVRVSDQLPQDGKSQVDAKEQTRGLYLEYNVEHDYEFDEGKISVPLATSAEGKKTIDAVALRERLATLHTRFYARRIGARPEPPKPAEKDVNGIKLTLIGRSYRPSTPRTLADGVTYLYGIDGEYRYAMERPPTDNEMLNAGSRPDDRSDSKKNAYKLSETDEKAN